MDGDIINSTTDEAWYNTGWTTNNNNNFNISTDDNATTHVSNEITLSMLFLKQSRFWVQKVLVPLVVFVGLIGNSVTVVVLTRRKMRSSTNSYLTALAVSDFIYLVTTFSMSFQHVVTKDLSYFAYWKYLQYVRCITDACSKYNYKILTFIPLGG